MQRGSLNDFLSFLAVAREKSFTRAAAKLGVAQSTLSHTIRELEARLGVRLLARTTRSVGLTDAGERLFRTVAPRLDEIDAEVAALSELRDKPAGTIRITAGEHAAQAVLWPALAKLLPAYPDITVEIVVDYGLINIVAERYDAGVRLARLLCPAPAPEDAAGADGPSLHQSAPTDLRWDLCLGVREGRTRAEGPGGRAAGVQQPDAPTQRRPVGSRPRLPAGGSGAPAHQGGETGSCACRLVSGLFRLSPLLSEPPAADTGLYVAGGCLAIPGLVTR